MDTLQERLGVAVESDAVRFSGAEFAAGRGVAVARRVRRRRAARTAGYGGGTVLAVGALAVGGAKLPWAGFVGLDVGAEDCVTVGASMGTDAAPLGADVVYSAVVEVEYGTATVRVPGRATAEDPEALTVAPRYIISYTTDGSVEVEAADGSRQVGDLTPDSPLHFTGADGRDVSIVLSPSGDVLSVIVEAQGGESLSLSTPSSSVDCVTPTPSASSDSSSALAPELEGEIPGSPFSYGTVLDTEEHVSEKLFFDGVEWVPADQMNRRIELMFGENEGLWRAIGDGPVVVVELSDHVRDGEHTGGGIGGSIDPAIRVTQADVDPAANNLEVASGGIFVAVRNGVVVGKVRTEFPDPLVPPMIQWPTVGSEHQAVFVLLNPEDNFLDANGDVLTGEWDTYIVVGSGYFDETGEFTGLEYAWKKLEPPV